jgi:hypothetical protein
MNGVAVITDTIKYVQTNLEHLNNTQKALLQVTKQHKEEVGES